MRYWCIIFWTLLQMGCYTKQPEQGLYLDLTQQLYNKESTFKLSDICDSISYIPLETHTESVLKGLNMEIKFAANCIFINDNNVLYKFNAAGKYLDKLANHGRGPYEFMQIMSFDINTQTNELYVYDNTLGKIEVFDINFTPVRTLKPVPCNMHDIIINGNNIVGSEIRNDYRARGKEQNSLIVLDAKKGHKIFSRKSLIPSIKPEERSYFIFSTEIMKYQDHVYYKEHRSNTYYCLQDSSKQDSIVYCINVGPVYPAELDYNWERQDEIRNYSSFEGAIETSAYIFIYFYPKHADFRLVCYDKKRQKLIIFPEKNYL